jgi:hypothetical protein
MDASTDGCTTRLHNKCSKHCVSNLHSPAQQYRKYDFGFNSPPPYSSWCRPSPHTTPYVINYDYMTHLRGHPVHMGLLQRQL